MRKGFHWCLKWTSCTVIPMSKLGGAVLPPDGREISTNPGCQYPFTRGPSKLPYKWAIAPKFWGESPSFMAGLCLIS